MLGNILKALKVRALWPGSARYLAGYAGRSVGIKWVALAMPLFAAVQIAGAAAQSSPRDSIVEAPPGGGTNLAECLLK